MVNDTTYTENDIWQLLGEIKDPEIPVLTVHDLGIIRNVELKDNKCIVTITPTYSGCPAMNVIAVNIYNTLSKKGIKNIRVNTVLTPAWTTDWMSDEAKAKLQKYGIAPPQGNKGGLLNKETSVKCPHCGSENTELKSQFGSTACKALFHCRDCHEPFEYFKCH